MTRSEIWSAFDGSRRKLAMHNPLAYRMFCKELKDCQYGIEPIWDAWDWFMLGWKHHRIFINEAFK